MAQNVLLVPHSISIALTACIAFIAWAQQKLRAGIFPSTHVTHYMPAYIGKQLVIVQGICLWKNTTNIQLRLNSGVTAWNIHGVAARNSKAQPGTAKGSQKQRRECQAQLWGSETQLGPARGKHP